MMIVGFDMTPPAGEILDMVKVMSSSGSKRLSSVTLTVLQPWRFVLKGIITVSKPLISVASAGEKVIGEERERERKREREIRESVFVSYIQGL